MAEPLTTPPADAGIPGTILEAGRLLIREAGHWLPIVAVLSMIAALPEALIEHSLPDSSTIFETILQMDMQAIAAGAAVVGLLLGMKLVIELVALMFAFVILADLSAGRRPDIWAGMRRLASWKLQFAWLVAGMFEQTAISMWFMGGTLLLLPMGLVTTAAYEEDNGFQAFQSGFRLGLLEMGPARPGIRVAVAVTLGFLIGDTITGIISFASCAASAASAGPGLFDAMNALQSGQMPAAGMPTVDAGFGWGSLLFNVLVAPIAMLPTVYMITVQQMTYWQARRFEEGHAERVAAGGA